jgi:hypothetical protein
LELVELVLLLDLATVLTAQTLYSRLSLQQAVVVVAQEATLVRQVVLVVVVEH